MVTPPWRLYIGQQYVRCNVREVAYLNTLVMVEKICSRRTTSVPDPTLQSALMHANQTPQCSLTIARALGRLQLEVSLSLFPHVEAVLVACASGLCGRICAREGLCSRVPARE